MVYAEARQQRTRRTVENQRRTQREAERTAFKPLRRTPFACAAEAQPALEALAQAFQATPREGGNIRPVTRYGKRGRPPAETSSRQVESRIEGALASSLAYRHTLLETKRGCIVATNELDTTVLPASERWAGDKKPSTAERGFRFLKAPRFLATALSLNKPERMMALLMVMTIGLLVYAALEYRLRQARHVQQETCPEHKGQPGPTPPGRGLFHDLVGSPVLLGAGTAPLVWNLNTQHQLVLRLWGAAYEALYA